MAAPSPVQPGRGIHFVGIGGMGMAPLALALAECGLRITGEDARPAPEVLRWLQVRGIVLSDTLPPEGEVDAVVFSSAVPASHPRLREARERGLPVFRRGEALAAFARDRRLIAVVGAHGKTSTCAMLVTALRAAGLDAGYVLGGLFADDSIPPAGRGSSEWLVAEVDESDGTIDEFGPEITLCVNLDLDHCDRYPDLAAIEAAFGGLADRTTGSVFFNQGCEVSRRLFRDRNGGRAVSFGPGGEYDLLGSVEGGAGRVLSLGGRFGQTTARVRAAGEFNALNACAALAVAGYLGVAPDPELLARFPGVRRRQSLLVAGGHLKVMEDYAHHPSEIAALLESIRGGVDGRLVVVFQPHRYSRTARFRQDFAKALAGVDKLFLMDVYPAGEAPMEGGGLEDLRSAFPEPPEVVADDEAGRAVLADTCRERDFLVFVGAGSIDGFARRTVASIGRQNTRLGRVTAFHAALAGRHTAADGLRTDEPLAGKTTIRIGGPAELYAEPATLEELRGLLMAAHEAGLPVHVLGRGSNLIVPDEGVAGLVIRLQDESWRRIQKLGDGRLLVGAGLRLKELCGRALREGWPGFEFLEGIPGTLGGALRMNAGAMGGWIYEVVDEVHLITPGGEIRVLGRDELSVGYRSCAELEEAIAIGAVLHPVSGAREDGIRARIADYRDRRQETQPREPSAGCIFRHPEGHSAGRLIDELGLKGERVGDAEISRIHGNFIVNLGSATAGDVVALVRKVRKEVLERKRIVLEPEVLLYGREWKDVL